MVTLLDADVIIRGEKGTFALEAWLASLPDEEFAFAAITVAELWHGVVRADERHRDKRQEYLEAILGAISVLPYTHETAYEHASIWAELQSAGKMIGAYDLIVVATALEHGCRVATFNKQHFSRVKGLKIVQPKQSA